MKAELQRFEEIPSRHADGGREYYYEFHVGRVGPPLIGPRAHTFDPPPGQQRHSENSRPMRPPHGPRVRPFDRPDQSDAAS